LRLLFALGEEQERLRIARVLGEFALEIDAANEYGVVAVMRFLRERGSLRRARRGAVAVPGLRSEPRASLLLSVLGEYRFHVSSTLPY